jgi:hypothetical protein
MALKAMAPLEAYVHLDCDIARYTAYVERAFALS